MLMTASLRARLILILLLAVLVPRRLRACDMCSIYSAVQLRDATSGVAVGVAQQFTHFGTLQLDGDEVPNPGNERMESSISQLVVAYAPIESIGLQANLPVIARHYRRNVNGGSEKGTKSGIGDASFLLRYQPIALVEPERSLYGSLLVGVKVPTGDSDALGDESGTQTATVHGPRPRHDTGGPLPSGIHGHDLALGSGSLDAFFGADTNFVWQRFFVTASIQYRLRNTGSFDYRYADELDASINPGFFLFAEHGYTLAGLALLETETKGKDQTNGAPENDTALTALYAGPALRFTWYRGLSFDLGGLLPAIRNNSGLQVVPDYRIRAALFWHF